MNERSGVVAGASFVEDARAGRCIAYPEFILREAARLLHGAETFADFAGKVAAALHAEEEARCGRFNAVVRAVEHVVKLVSPAEAAVILVGLLTWVASAVTEFYPVKAEGEESSATPVN